MGHASPSIIQMRPWNHHLFYPSPTITPRGSCQSLTTVHPTAAQLQQRLMQGHPSLSSKNQRPPSLLGDHAG